MKRVYDTVDVSAEPSGFAITLDGRPLKTPAGASVTVPKQRLADAVAREWADQQEAIRPETMPYTRLVNAVIDGIAPSPAPVIESLERIAGSDLLCYRAESPQELVARQDSRWQPLLDWAAETFGARLRVTKGLRPVDQPPAALKLFADAFAALDPFALASAHTTASLSGSAVIALALAHGRLDADEAWAIARIDEDWQIEQWGEDAEAAARDLRRKREFAISVEVLRMMGLDRNRAA